MTDVLLALGNIGAVPDLFGNKARLAGDRLHRLREMLRHVHTAGDEGR